MDTTLRQAGELLLDAVPTVILLLLLYAIYQNVVRKPLERVLAQRRDRTEGAVEKARANIAAAESRTQEYEEKLREARMAIFKSQEARRQRAQQLRTQALEEARARAQEQIRQARAAVEQEVAQARTGLQADAQRLASEIIHTILRRAGAASRIGGPA
jgi:F-type H+-transporting ATPase subunit b